MRLRKDSSAESQQRLIELDASFRCRLCADIEVVSQCTGFHALGIWVTCCTNIKAYVLATC